VSGSSHLPARGFLFSLCYGRGSKRRCTIRWFKHLSEAADDEKLADILTEYGPEGYGVWWLMIEVVAKQMDKTLRCEAEYPIGVWSKKCFVSKRKTLEFLQLFAEKKLIFLKENEKKISVEIPNLLKFRDEYSTRSG
jgi:hypothetical protein